MPNEANKSKQKTGIVQKKRKPTMPVTDKQQTEGSAAKDNTGSNNQKGAGSASKADSNSAAGGGND